MEAQGRENAPVGNKMKGDTWPKVLKYNYEKYDDTRRAMRHKYYGIWQPYTWKDYYLNVKHLALGFLSIGFELGDRMLIIGDNAPQWYFAELAAQANHGAAVGLYSGLPSSEIEILARNCEARFAVVQDQEQIDKLLEVQERLPSLKKVVYWSYKGLTHYDDPILIGYNRVLQLGREYEAEHPGLFEKNVESGRADDICAIVHTSGTTGDSPKGAVHTFETLMSGARNHLDLDPWNADDNVLPHMPPVWIVEQWFGIGCHLLSACVLNFAEDPGTQWRDMGETGPSIVFFWAKLWEHLATSVQGRILGADPVKRLAFRLLMPVGYRMADLRMEKRTPGLLFKLLHAVAEVALFRPIRKSLGLQNARICYTTGATIGPEAFRFFHALDLPLKSLYALTEGGALTGARNDDIRPDTVGPVHKGAEVRITDEGELICRQPGVFTGYYGDPAGTQAVLKDGWFYSGDSADIREDGHVVFLDRLRDLVPLSRGDVLAPQTIESRLRFSPRIKDAWVLAGPNADYVSAVIVIDYDAVGRWAGQKGVSYTTFTELAQAPEVYELVREDIERVNRTLPAGVRVRRYVNLHKEFNPEEGEVTWNRKLRRACLEERYRGLVDAIYGDENEVEIEAQTGHRDGSQGTANTTIRITSVEGGGS